jgi:hypothetical protein
MQKLIGFQGLEKNISTHFKCVLKMEKFKAQKYIKEYFQEYSEEYFDDDKTCLNIKGFCVELSHWCLDFPEKLRKVALQISFLDRLIKGEDPETIVNNLTKGYDELYKKKNNLLEQIMSLKNKFEFSELRYLTDRNIWLYTTKGDFYIRSVEIENTSIDVKDDFKTLEIGKSKTIESHLEIEIEILKTILKFIEKLISEES